MGDHLAYRRRGLEPVRATRTCAWLRPSSPPRQLTASTLSELDYERKMLVVRNRILFLSCCDPVLWRGCVRGVWEVHIPASSTSSEVWRPARCTPHHVDEAASPLFLLRCARRGVEPQTSTANLLFMALLFFSHSCRDAWVHAMKLGSANVGLSTTWPQRCDVTRYPRVRSPKWP